MGAYSQMNLNKKCHIYKIFNKKLHTALQLFMIKWDLATVFYEKKKVE